MSFAVVHSRALDALEAQAVTVEVHLANGLPSFTLVGLADTEVKESRERVRAALLQSGFAFPHNKRITVNLAPADLPKESGRFDLPIALGILAAAGHIDPRAERFEFAGELSLAGELRPVRGALALALAVRRRAPALPGAADRKRAGCGAVGGLDIRAPTACCRWCSRCSRAMTAELPRAQRCLRRRHRPHRTARRQGPGRAKRALEIAAAGAHSLLLIGPPGTGKSMLALRLAGILPPMDEAEALASAALQGLATQGFDAQRSASGRSARRTIRPVRWRWWAAARRRGPARSRWPMAACCSSTSCRSSPAPPWKRCASRWKAGASPSRAPRGRRPFRRASSWWRR